MDDQKRFHEILKNKVRHNLGKYVSSDHLIGQQGGKTIKIPIHNIDLPHFTFGSNAGGVGMGPGNPGDPMGGDKSEEGKAGNQEGEHDFSAEFTPDELAQMLGEELNLPNIEDKGKGKVSSLGNKYTDIRKIGPESLKSFKRTYKEALKRSIAAGSYDPSNPSIIPIKEDRRYRSFDEVEIPEVNTAIIYLMDVSGSMGERQKNLVKSEVFWIDLWLKHQYKEIETRFVVHDVLAKEVSREEFFSISESGGTMISTAYDFVSSIMSKDYPFSEWNVYPFHFSDGDNWSDDDNEDAIKILNQSILPNCNLFSYGQVISELGSGQFLKALYDAYKDKDNITLSQISSKEDILPSIKTFFGKGK